MKYFLILCSLMVFLSCELPTEYDIREPSISFSSMSELRGWMNENLRYRSDAMVYGVSEYWAAPQEFIDKGRGDCEDYAILAMYFLDKMGYDVELVGVKIYGGYNHALVAINGVIYEPQGLFPVCSGYYELEFLRMSLAECLARCNSNGSRSVINGIEFSQMFPLEMSWFLTVGYVPQLDQYLGAQMFVIDPARIATVAQIGVCFTTANNRFSIYGDVESYQYSSFNFQFYPFRVDYSVGVQVRINSWLRFNIDHECDHPVSFRATGGMENTYLLQETKFTVTIHGKTRLGN